MGKFFLRFILVGLIAIISVVIFLTHIGFETDRFDNLIKNKTNEINQNLKLDFQKTKIHLNLTELNLVVKLQKPKILIKNNKIDLSKLDLFLSLKSFFSSDFLLKRAEVAFVKKKNGDFDGGPKVMVLKFTSMPPDTMSFVLLDHSTLPDSSFNDAK